VLGADGILFVRGARPFGSALCGIGITDSVLPGGARLPLDLTPFAATGCSLYIDPLALLPAALTRLPRSGNGEAQVIVSIPVASQLVGAALFAQWFMQDPGVNPLHLTFSNGVRATIGNVPAPLGIGYLESVDPASPTGRVIAGHAPVLRFTR
jgi:hypothetical protein